MDVIKTYITYKADPDNDSKKDTHFCQDHNISYRDLQLLKEKFPSWAKDALDLRRDAYSEKMTSIDSALFTAAAAGDTKAAELIYRRFDGWNPKIVEQTNNYYNFADLVKDASKDGGDKPRRAKQIIKPL